jgi:hypothetical protein
MAWFGEPVDQFAEFVEDSDVTGGDPKPIKICKGNLSITAR